jgi:hypothetical protein
LEKDAARRYQTMSDLVLDLERVRRECESVQAATSIGDAPTAKLEAAISEPRGGWRRPFISRAALAIAVVVALVGAAIVYALFFRGPALTPAPGITSVNSAAYDDYLRGKVMVGSQYRENNDAAIKLLEQAVKADPRFAAAWAQLVP